VNALHSGIVAGDRMDKLCREKAVKRGWTPARPSGRLRGLISQAMPIHAICRASLSRRCQTSAAARPSDHAERD